MLDPLAGKRILVAEDEYFIAADLKNALMERGVDVVGPIAEVEQALACAIDARLDAAVLDVNLKGVNSYSIADLLEEQRIPYLFLTGYDIWALPKRYQNAPCMEKPSPMHTVLRRIEQLFLDPGPDSA